MSTGVERGGRGCEGVEMPGVAGGVKAGEIREGGGLGCVSCIAISFRVLFRSGSCPECERSKLFILFGLDACGE